MAVTRIPIGECSSCRHPCDDHSGGCDVKACACRRYLPYFRDLEQPYAAG